MKTRSAVSLLALALICTAFSYAEDPTIVVQWNEAVLQGVRDSTLGPPMVARALAIVHTCIYDAWAAYDARAAGTQLGGSLRRPYHEHTLANQTEAISFAAYRAATDLFPGDKASVFDPFMAQLGYDISDMSTDTRTPSGIGNVACAAVLEFRHSDGSNQLGFLANPSAPTGVPYADYTGYVPVNKPSTVPVSDLLTIVDPNRWQPLTYVNGTTVVTPAFVGAQWFKVAPFALTSVDQFLPLISTFGPALYPSAAFVQQANDLITMSAGLSDEQKMIAEYWANGTALGASTWTLGPIRAIRVGQRSPQHGAGRKDVLRSYQRHLRRRYLLLERKTPF
jgi:hypothetical protein